MNKDVHCFLRYVELSLFKKNVDINTNIKNVIVLKMITLQLLIRNINISQLVWSIVVYKQTV